MLQMPVADQSPDLTEVDQGSVDIMDQGPAQKPPRPTIPDQLKDWTRKWWMETSPSPERTEALEQYKLDYATLFPEKEMTAQGLRGKKAGAKRSRKDNREVMTPRVYQYSLQTQALLCPGDLSIKIEARDEIPPMGGMPKTAGTKSRDPYLEQFARTIDDRLSRHYDECAMMPTLRDFSRHCVWFQAGVIKLGYQREIGDSGLVGNRLPDAQDDLQYFQYLLLCYLRGDFDKTDADFQTLVHLKETIADSHEIDVYQNLIAENIPLTRFIWDPQVKSGPGMRNAKWQGDEFVMTGAEILSQWPYKPKPDGTWEGVHEDDLKHSSVYDRAGTLIEEAESRKVRNTEQFDSGSKRQRESDPIEDRCFLVREVWAACEGKRVFWLIDGLDYPARNWRPKRQHGFWYPYFTHVLNPQPGSWLGRSDTQQQGPVQDRINRKKSDQEIARWLSMGGRGVADVSQVDGKVIDDIRNLSPGEILKANLQGEDIRKALMWLEVPYFKEAFETTDDEADERLTHRMPSAAMGVTDAKTTATAINAATQGSNIAFQDRQSEFNMFLSAFVQASAEIVILEDRPEDVRSESGPHALWPKVFGDKEAQKIKAEIEKRVNDQVTEQVQATIYEAQMSGSVAGLDPVAMTEQIDHQIAMLTEQECLKSFGYPEPLSREGLYKKLQFKIKANMNAAMDKEKEIQNITMLLQQVIGLGIPINPEPVARLLSSLYGAGDEFNDIFKPDPNQLVAMLAQIAQADPSQITPESAATIAKMGMMAAQYLQQAGIDPATGQPIDGGEAPAKEKSPVAAT
jgi:hypothetical protein